MDIVHAQERAISASVVTWRKITAPYVGIEPEQSRGDAMRTIASNAVSP